MVSIVTSIGSVGAVEEEIPLPKDAPGETSGLDIWMRLDNCFRYFHERKLINSTPFECCGSVDQLHGFVGRLLDFFNVQSGQQHGILQKFTAILLCIPV